jgi:hypothetical protein
MKDLKEQRDAAQRQCDQQDQHILSLEANLSAADEKRRRLRKELVEVSSGSLNKPVHSDCTARLQHLTDCAYGYMDETFRVCTGKLAWLSRVLTGCVRTWCSRC